MKNKRLEYLMKTFQITEISEFKESLMDDEAFVYLDVNLEHDATKNTIIAVKNEEEGLWRITRETFDLFVERDPTIKKIYVQWFLNMTKRFLKLSLIDDLVRFVSEDLFIIEESLLKFDQLKKTKRFKEFSKKIHSLKNIKDTLDINQYMLVEQLHDAIYPFEENNSKGLVKRLELLVSTRKGEILFEDKNFIVFTPLTLSGSVEFYGIGKWCTTRPGNGMFKSYTSRKNGLGKLSKLFIVINKNVDFSISENDTEVEELNRKYGIFQLHFESGQINNQRNAHDPEKFVSHFLNKSNGLSIFFKEILEKYLKGKYTTNTLVSFYSKVIKSLNFIDILINLLPSTNELIELKDICTTSRLVINDFPNLKVLKLTNMNMEFIPIMNFPKTLEVISFQSNNIHEFPSILIELTNIKSINLSDNPISKVPSSISSLEPLNGGRLLNLSLRGCNLNKSEKEKIKALLPSVLITY